MLDGFELVVTRIPRRLNAAMLRRVLARVQARESVLIAVGEPGPLVPDIALEASTPVWEGVADGWGHLCGRRVTVAATGRRVPRPRRAELWLPGPGGGVAAVEEPLPAQRRRAPAALGGLTWPRPPPRPHRRMVTVWCPDWPVVAAGVAAATPAVVLHANRVVARSPAAAAEGVVIGQRRRQAQQLCPDVALLDHDPDRDARAFEPVVRAIGRFAPRLEVVEPGWLCLGARGPSRYFGGDERLAEQLVAAVHQEAAAVERSGLGIGIADGRFAAGVAARRAGRAPMVVAPGTSPAFLDPLPGGLAAPPRRGRSRARRAVRPHGPGPPRGPRRAARPVTSSPASDRPVATPTASPAGSTTASPAGPSRHPSGGSSRPSTIRSSSSSRWCSSASTSPISSSPRWPPRGGCAPASS